MAQRLQEHLACLAEEMRPYQTGATFVNIRLLSAWNPERTRFLFRDLTPNFADMLKCCNPMLV